MIELSIIIQSFLLDCSRSYYGVMAVKYIISYEFLGTFTTLRNAYRSVHLSIGINETVRSPLMGFNKMCYWRNFSSLNCNLDHTRLMMTLYDLHALLRIFQVEIDQHL